MLYHLYEFGHAAVSPVRAAAGNYEAFFKNPFNPLTHTTIGRHAAAACEVFERTTRRYDKPEFGLKTTRVDGKLVNVREEVVWHRPFCRLLRFQRDVPAKRAENDTKVLIVAPMSGHYATLLRGTVERFLPDHDVYITDWQDAATVPLAAGRFDLDTYIDYITEMIAMFGGDVHVFAVCQPSVPVLAAIALMEQANDPNVPASLTLAGGPVDTRVSPTAVNELAEEKGTEWFEANAVGVVPWTNMGYGRMVYPGFLQLSGFMTMNLDRHMTAHKDLFVHLVYGDCDSAEKHREFYDEYLAVMDLTAEFYLQTIDTVFVRHALPKGEMRHYGRKVDLGAIRHVPIMTIEGEKDDITGLGQCRAVHDLTPNLAPSLKLHYEAKGVGHYGIFNGSRFRKDIAPRITQFIHTHDPRAEQLAAIKAIKTSEVKDASHINGCDVSEVAFTFAPANDEQPDGMAPILTRQGLPAGTHAKEEDDALAFFSPFRLWVLASQMMIEGFLGPRQI